MGRRGFCSVATLVFVTISSAVGGIMLIRATDTARVVLDASVRSKGSAAASICGVKLAEDWLISSISSGDVPRLRMNGCEAPLSRVEALLADGSGAGGRAGRDEYAGHIRAELYVADTDYESGIFRVGSSPWNPSLTPGIPRIPVISTPDGVTRHYYLRSWSRVTFDDSAVIREEVVVVTVDHLGRISGIRRLFSRSRAEPG
jgi:hypothetical protein